MDTSRLLFLVFMLITPSGCTEPAKCLEFDLEPRNVLEGEAFYFVPSALKRNITDEQVTWYKNKTENVTTNEEERVHYHGGALFFLNLVTEDSGRYTAREIKPSGKCINHYLKIKVVKGTPTTNPKLLYGEINSSQNPLVQCPIPVRNTCKDLGGQLSWKKDSIVLQGRHEADLWIENFTKGDEGIYTCICTWTHNNKTYSSSGSRRLNYAVRIYGPATSASLVTENGENGSGHEEDGSGHEEDGAPTTPHERAHITVKGPTRPHHGP